MIKQVACVAIATTALAAFCDAATVVRASVSLKDGSSVKGEFLTKHISGSTLFKKDLALAPAIVRNITFTGTNGESKVELVNSDRFAMTVTNDAFAVRSMLGDLKIPRKNFRSISLSARSAGTEGGAADGLIFHCTFDDERSIVSPAVGPAGRFMTGGFMEGKSGQALMTVPYTRHAAFDFPAGFLKDAGCVAFWAKILKQTPSVGMAATLGSSRSSARIRMTSLAESMWYQMTDRGIPVLR